MMLLQNKQVAIVGGGPAGLTLARLLQMQGISVQVYERDINQYARVQGSPLDMHEDSGLAAIRKAGLLDVFRKTFRPGADRMIITDDQANVVFSDHENPDKPAEDFGNAHFRPEIDRGPLRKMLLDSLQPGTVIWDRHFISMKGKDEGWLLSFKNNYSAYADLVIACDGANSKIRPYLTPIQPFYSGITMIEGTVPNAVALTPSVSKMIKGGKIMAFGNEKDILLGQKGNGELGFYLSLKLDVDWIKTSGLDFSDRHQIIEWYKINYSDWGATWLELIEQSALPFIPRPIFCIPFDQSWKTLSNLTMIGDAAHVMPPFAGEGANMAMLDALELSECLTDPNFKSLPDAIENYEIKMRQRAAIAAQESLQNGERMHSKTALHDMLAFFGSFHAS